MWRGRLKHMCGVRRRRFLLCPARQGSRLRRRDVAARREFAAHGRVRVHGIAATMNSTPPGFPLWITADGEIDLDTLPIDGILKQPIDPDNLERIRAGCAALGSWA